MNIKGITGGAVLAMGMMAIGYDNYVSISNERIYGNAMNDTFMDEIRKIGDVKLIITVDHCSASENYIKELLDMGIETVVTDHHLLKDGKPPMSAKVFINPQNDDKDTYKNLSGCAVGYVLMKRLIDRYNQGRTIDLADPDNEYINKMKELVAISTIGDMMDMRDPVNRAITQEGIEILNNSTLGKAYRRVLKYPKVIDSKDIAFTICPMINATGRLGEARTGLHSLLPPNRSEVIEMQGSMRMMDSANLSNGSLPELIENRMCTKLSKLIELNTLRKAKQKVVMNDAKLQLDDNDRVNVIALDRGAGINGVIASNLSRSTNRPTIVFIVSDDYFTGSMRGELPDFHVKDCFDYIHNKDKTVFYNFDGEYKFGGHKGAGGCSVSKDKLDRFKELTLEYMDVNDIKHDPAGETERLLRDAIDVTFMPDLANEIDSIKQLEPFGNHFKSPILKFNFDLIKNYKAFRVNDFKIVKFTGVLNDFTIDATYFAESEEDIEIRDSTILGTISFNRGLCLDVVSILPRC